MAQFPADFRSRCGGVAAMLGVVLLAAQAVGQAGGAAGSAAAGPGGGATEPDFGYNWAAAVGDDGHDVARGVAVLSRGVDPSAAVPDRRVGTVVVAGDRDLGAVDQRAFIRFSLGSNDTDIWEVELGAEPGMSGISSAQAAASGDPEVGVVATDGALPPIHVAVETHDDSDPDLSPGFGDPNLEDLVRRAIIRAAYCPGDFNLDGEVDGDDWTAFQAACGIDPRADWDFDGDYNCDTEDVMLFQSSMNAGCCDE